VSFEWLRRIIRVMGIVEMQPEEKRSLLVTAQPRQRAIGHILGAPLHALVAVFARLTLVKIGVIHVEAALETREQPPQDRECRLQGKPQCDIRACARGPASTEDLCPAERPGPRDD